MSAPGKDEANEAPRWRLLPALPLIAFLALAGLFMLRLGGGDPGRLPSALIGKEAPAVDLPGLPGLG